LKKTHNWSGINVEPIKEVFDKLIHNRGYSEMISDLKAQFDLRHIERLNNELDLHGGVE
jgi:hypothetical protein